VNRSPNHGPHSPPKDDGIALVIVLGFVVLLCLLVVAYFSRTTTDRQLAGSSFNQTNANTLAQSALDLIVGDLKQEIVTGSFTSTANGITIYTPSTSLDAVPRRSGAPTTIPNLVRRSVSSDSIPSPGIGSRASAVNSTTDVSLNGRSISLARWNSHYLIPKINTSVDASDPIAAFVAPDWVIVSRSGPAVQSGIGAGSTALNNRLVSNPNYVIGRYAYAIYDEGGLLDVNVAGFPSPTPAPATIAGRKGVLAFADLTALPTTGAGFVSNTAINRIIGWRNYATVQPSGVFPGFTFTAAASSTFATYFLHTARNFGTVAATVSGGRTDQAFLTRAELIQLRSSIAASVNMLQCLGTFSRERNHPTWGTSLNQLAGRFPLNRFDLFATTPPSAANATLIQQYFGLTYVPATLSPASPEHWQYNGTNGNTRQTSVPALSGTNQDPHLFTLLKYALPASSDSELLSIGASLIDQRDSDSNTTWIEFGDPAFAAQKAFGVDSIPPPHPLDPRPGSAPVMLKRAFRNVGELGYVYRNASTTLDFISAGGSDVPILDLFTYNIATPRSGVVNINTQNAPVLAAVLMGAITIESTSATVSRANATTAANSIVAATRTQPAVGRQDITRLASASVVTNSPFTTSEETRETIVRALAEVGQTRTWGLLIDVIAQSGRYPPNATTLADFVVDGERRYWLHVAIDRFTGEVIDQQLEAVYE